VPVSNDVMDDINRWHRQTVAEKDARIAELEAENGRFRGLLANSDANCLYCGLPATKMAECARGFPGCGRADDWLWPG
jgi:hypothetical protein